MPVPQGFAQQSYQSYLAADSHRCEIDQQACFIHIDKESFLDRVKDQHLSSANVYAQLMRKLILVLEKQGHKANDMTILAFEPALKNNYSDDAPVFNIALSEFYEHLKGIMFKNKSIIEYL